MAILLRENLDVRPSYKAADILLFMKFRRTIVISAGLLAFLTGLVIAKSSSLQVNAFYLSLLFPLIFMFRRRAPAFLLLVVAFGLLVGIWRGGQMQKSVARYEDFTGRNILLSGRIVDDPVYDDEGRLDFRINSVTVEDESLPGQVRIKTHSNGLRRGDVVNAGGRLSDGFGNYQASVYFASIEVVKRSTSQVESLRREFFAAVYNVLPEPQASLGLGFLVGLRSALPEDLDDQLKIAGLTHIVVASGYNLTILVRLSRRLLARYSKYQAFVGSVALIVAFLAITGASPSMVRASVVTILSLLAWYYGRKFQPIVIILLGAAITAGSNPLYIWHDLGWWLSFLAFTGVLVIAPLISARLWKSKQPPLLMQVAIETAAAQLMATPLILFIFGDVSLVALFANIAVVPFIPFAMAATFVAGTLGVFLPSAFVAWIAVPARLILGYIVSVTQLFASPSWAQIPVGISKITLGIIYASVTIFGVILYHRSKIRFHKVPSIVE